MKKLLLFALLISSVVSAANAGVIAPILSPLTTFGGGDGFIAAGERTWLTTNTTERGMAYNPATNHLLVVSRAGTPSVRKIDAITGADLGTMNVGPFGEGIFPINMIAADDGGAVYAGNLSDGVNSRFWIYLWPDESSVMGGGYRNIPLDGARLGDSLDVIGRYDQGNGFLVAGYNSIPSVPGNGGYAYFYTSGGPPFGGGHVTFTGTQPSPGDHRLGITFLNDEHTVLGTQGGIARLSQTSNFSASLTTSIALATASERLMDYAVVGGKPLLATCDTATNIVRVYDMTNQSAPLLLDSLATAPATNDNSFGVGQVKWGAINGSTATLYAMNTNNGIQAFNVVVPEPVGLPLVGFAILMRRRRRKSQ